MVSEITGLFKQVALRANFPLVSTLAITAIAALLRFVNLANPHTLIFDETYYVKDAYALGQFGSERVWPDDANQDFESGNPNVLTDVASYVVHPPLGKWIIWLGMWIFGAESSFGWRFSTALLGTLSVPLLIAIARKLTRSAGFASIAGLFLALEGQSIVLSRTAILDGILTFFILVGLWFLIKTVEHTRQRILQGKTSLHLSPWLPLMGVALGMGAAVKWSAIYFIVAFGLLTFIFDWSGRVRNGFVRLGAIAQGFVNALVLFVSSAATYLASWAGWVLDERAWGRHLESSWLSSLFSYHLQVLQFHTSLDKDHPYQSGALEWLINLRPTAFYFESIEGEGCQLANECSVAITAMPNLVIWFSGLFAMLWIFKNRLANPSALIVAVGFLAAWLPWIFFPERTIFQFYAVLISPFFILALVIGLQHYWKRGFLLGVQSQRERRIGYLVFGSVLMAAWHLTLWLGIMVPEIIWRLQLFLPFWI